MKKRLKKIALKKNTVMLLRVREQEIMNAGAAHTWLDSCPVNCMSPLCVPSWDANCPFERRG